MTPISTSSTTAPAIQVSESGPWPGDNKYSMTIFARNPDDGKAKWAYQKTPHDAWDYDGINENVLADLTIKGQPRKVLVNFDRNGFAYVLDRATGELLMADPFVNVNWATGVDLKTGKPIENPEKRTSATKNTKDICPSAMGGKNQQPVAYSPKTNLFYVPTNNLCMDYEGVEVKYQSGQPYVGAIVVSHPALAATGRVRRPGSHHRQEGLGHQGRAIELGRSPRHCRRCRVLWHHGRMDEGGQRQDGRGLVEVQDAFWNHRESDDHWTDGRTWPCFGHHGWSGIAVAADIGTEDPTPLARRACAFGSVSNFCNQGGVLTVFSPP
jgi:hypothetical protein